MYQLEGILRAIKDTISSDFGFRYKEINVACADAATATTILLAVATVVDDEDDGSSVHPCPRNGHEH